jgi:hypothetical protein
VETHFYGGVADEVGKYGIHGNSLWVAGGYDGLFIGAGQKGRGSSSGNR